MLANIPLDHSNGQPLILQLTVQPSHHEATQEGLELGNDLGQSFITQILQTTQHTSSEKHLAVTKAIFIVLQL